MGLADAKAMSDAKKRIKAAQAEGKKLTVARACVDMGVLTEKQAKKVQLELKRLKAGLASSGEFIEEDASGTGATETAKGTKKRKAEEARATDEKKVDADAKAEKKAEKKADKAEKKAADEEKADGKAEKKADADETSGETEAKDAKAETKADKKADDEEKAEKKAADEGKPAKAEKKADKKATDEDKPAKAEKKLDKKADEKKADEKAEKAPAKADKKVERKAEPKKAAPPPESESESKPESGSEAASDSEKASGSEEASDSEKASESDGSGSDAEAEPAKGKAKIGKSIELDSQKSTPAIEAAAATATKTATKRRAGAPTKTKAEAPSASGQRSKTPMLAAGALVAVLLVGLAVFIVASDRKDPKGSTAANPTTSETPTPSLGLGTPPKKETEAEAAPNPRGGLNGVGGRPTAEPAGAPKTPAEKRVSAERTMNKVMNKAWDLINAGKFKEAIDQIETFPADLRGEDVWPAVGEREIKNCRAFLAEQELFARALDEARAGKKDELRKQVARVEKEDYDEKFRNQSFVERFKKDAREVLGDKDYDKTVAKAEIAEFDAATKDLDAVTSSDPDDTGPIIPTAASVETRGNEARRAAMKAASKEAQSNLGAAKKTLEQRRAARLELVKKEAAKVIAATKATKLKYQGKDAQVSAYDENGFAIKVGGRDELRFGWGNGPAELCHDIKFLAIDTGNAQAIFDLGMYAARRLLFVQAARHFKKAGEMDAKLKARAPDVAQLELLGKLFRGKGTIAKAGELTTITWPLDQAQEALDFEVYAEGMVREIVAGTLKLGAVVHNLSLAKVRGAWDNTASIECTLATNSPAPMIGIASEGALFCVAFAEKTMLISLQAADAAALATSEVRATQGAKVKVETTVVGEKIKIKVTVGDREAFTHELPWEGPVSFALGGRGRGDVRFDDIKVAGVLSPKWEKRTKAAAPNEIGRALNEIQSRMQSTNGNNQTVPFMFRETSAEDAVALEGVNPAAIELVKAGRALLEQGNLGGALDSFTKAAEKDPDYHAAVYLASIMKAFREPDMALFRIERSIKGVEDFYECMVIKATALLRLNKVSEASAILAKVFELRPDYAPAYETKARVLINEGKYTEALALLELAEVLGPGDPYTINTLGEARALAEGPAWPDRKRVTTANYQLDTDYVGHADRLAKHLESIRQRYTEAFPNLVNPDAPKKPASVLVFNAADDYYQYSEQTTHDRAENTLGHFNPATGQLLLFLDAESDDPGALHVLYHEGMHQWAHAQQLALPFWANEGLAEYIGGTRMSDAGEIQERAICDSFLKGRLKGMLDWHKAMMPFEKIMCESPQEFYAGDASFKYGQAWAMVHWFMESGAKVMVDGEEMPIKELFSQYLAQFKSLGLDDKAMAGSKLQYIYVATFHKLDDIRAVEAEFSKYVVELAKKNGVDFIPAGKGDEKKDEKKDE